MPTPPYVLALREKVGHDLLLLPTVSAVVLDDDLLLLQRRADFGTWALPGGIVEPGEQPAEAVVREVLEETGIAAEVSEVLLVHATPAFAYPNGDRCQFVTTVYRCRAIGGALTAGHDETLEAAWWPLDALPPLADEHQERIAMAIG